MTYKQKYTSNKKLIKLYVASLKNEILEEVHIKKLAIEIGRLSFQNFQIENMLVENYISDCLVYDKEENSILNK